MEIKQFVKNLPKETKREKLYLKALKIACKMIRENPLCDISTYDREMFSILCGGTSRDPEGNEWVIHFLSKATIQLKEEEENINE